MAKYLITGVSGFVADYLIELLLKKYNDIEIVGIATRSSFVYPSEKVKYQQVDMLDSVKLKTLLEEFQPDYIVHLAAISSVGQSWSEPVETFQNNTNIFLNLVDSVRTLNLKTRILSVGSSEVYKADSLQPISENDITSPKNPYAVARLAQENISKLYADSYGLDIIMTRSFNHTGPKQSDKFVISSFIKQMVEISQNKSANRMYVGNIEVERDFLDVRDVVMAYDVLLQKGKTGEIYNVCSGIARKLKDVISETSKQLAIDVDIEVDPLRLRPNEIGTIVGDNKKICNKLGWAPQYAFMQTVADIIEYHRK